MISVRGEIYGGHGRELILAFAGNADVPFRARQRAQLVSALSESITTSRKSPAVVANRDISNYRVLSRVLSLAAQSLEIFATLLKRARATRGVSFGLLIMLQVFVSVTITFSVLSRAIISSTFGKIDAVELIVYFYRAKREEEREECCCRKLTL